MKNPTSDQPADPPQHGQPHQQELRDWLTLHRAPGIGPVTFHQLLARFTNPGQVLQSTSQELQAAGLGPVTYAWLGNPDASGIDRDLQWGQGSNCHIILYNSPEYPVLLKEIPDPPPVLFVIGDPAVLQQHQLAMVGSRNPTHSGRRTATDFARHLGSAGLLITSGLATGIDTASHQGAIQDGGSTIAVMATGPDQIYPASNQTLAGRIAENGALVTEFPVGTSPRPDHFPRRNRIISGLSLGTLVVEAAPRSGSLITARHALEQGREVFAIPGSIHNPLARGCHGLIRQGAKLVQTAADVLEELGQLAGVITQTQAPTVTDTPQEIDAEYVQLLEYIEFEPTTVDQLVNCSGLTPEAVSSMLLILELKGHVASSAGGSYTRIIKEGPR